MAHIRLQDSLEVPWRGSHPCAPFRAPVTVNRQLSTGNAGELTPTIWLDTARPHPPAGSGALHAANGILPTGTGEQVAGAYHPLTSTPITVTAQFTLSAGNGWEPAGGRHPDAPNHHRDARFAQPDAAPGYPDAIGHKTDTLDA